MKKFNLLMLTVLGAATVGNSVVHADDDTNTTKSTANVQFVQGDTPEPTPPGPDPINPSDDGPLTIDTVSNFNFGTENELQSKAQSYKLVTNKTDDYYNGDESDDSNLQPLVQVTDHRDGVPTGWNLTVSGTALTGKDVTDISGASITINNPSVEAADNTEASNNEATGKAFKIDLNGETSSVVMSADAGKGFGTWRNWLGKDMTLDMPSNSGAVKDVNYSSVLTWTIADTPAS